ncbi:glycosyl hydrolase family 18 protein [Fibrobacterales bacterium]|nr:glycosyl hydrolase family 18 protein [Fibrobacterales bacterium]
MKTKINLALIGITALGLSACLTSNESSDSTATISSVVETSSSSNQTLLSEDNSSSEAIKTSSGTDLSSSSDTQMSSITSNTPSTRVVGYIPLYRDQDDMFSKIDFSATTHVNISFVNPDDKDGGFLGFTYGGQWTAFKKHHSSLIDKNIKVLASIGGGGTGHKENYLHLMKDENKTAFISKLMDFAREEKLDGIDVDLEGDLVNTALYNPFVLELADSVKAQGLLYTAAVASWNGDKISKASLDSYDFINLMAYDETGPWSPTKIINHSTIEFAQKDLAYWSVKRGVAKEKIVLGVPFYGYKFTSSGVSAFTWDQYLTKFPANIEDDQVGTENTTEGIWFLNGRKTMKEKVLLGNTYGGIMIWELGQDTYDDTSLMQVVIDNIKQ